MSLIDTLVGKPLPSDDEAEQKIGVFLGIPTLGLDGLGSASYGPEAALTVLLPLGALGLACIGPIMLVILGLLLILYLSYRQTISAYPNGGGSYTVARENLGPKWGLMAAAALMLDYVLNVAVGISAGIGALVSAIPHLQRYTLTLCLATLLIIALVNLRGVRESGVLFAAPTYLFVGSLAATIVMGMVSVIRSGGHPHPVVPPAPLPPAAAAAGAWLLLRAFASGCTAMTGVEAVSNSITAFREPRVKNAEWTLTGIVVILGSLLAGIAYLAHAYSIGAMDQTRPGYQSVLSQLTAAVAGRGAFYYVTVGSILAVLTLSANTSYAGFPRLCRLVARDSYLPHSFAEIGRRLVHSVGIVFLTSLSGLLLIAFGGITDRLIPLFAIGAFLAFTFSQAGMVMHWLRILKKKSQDPKARATKRQAVTGLAINALGVGVTSVALGVIVVAKFTEGAWISLLIIPCLLVLFRAIHRHYVRVARQIKAAHELRLDHLDPPVVLVPVEGWNRLTERALRFGLRVSPDVTAVHIMTANRSDPSMPRARDDDPPERAVERLQERWNWAVIRPAAQAGIKPPDLVILDSPNRQLYEPLLIYIEMLKMKYPDRMIAVIIPELVQKHWWEVALHSHHATGLKAALLFLGDSRVAVVNVPWYLDEPNEEVRMPGQREPERKPGRADGPASRKKEQAQRPAPSSTDA